MAIKIEAARRLQAAKKLKTPEEVFEYLTGAKELVKRNGYAPTAKPWNDPAVIKAFIAEVKKDAAKNRDTDPWADWWHGNPVHILNAYIEFFAKKFNVEV